MTAFVLKIVAMLSMLTDHCDYLFHGPPICEYFGRLAFPLYAFMLVDSYRHLRSHPERMKKYVLTLAALAVVSEFAYDFAFTGTWVYWGGQNQILQFLSFVLAALLAERIDSRFLRVLLWAAVAALNQVCLMGYYALGILSMLVMKWVLDCFEAWDLKQRFMGSTLMMVFYWFGCVLQQVLMYSYAFIVNGAVRWAAVAALTKQYAVVLLLIPAFALYSGEYGKPPRWFRVLYKYFYPAHLFILGMIVWLMNRP